MFGLEEFIKCGDFCYGDNSDSLSTPKRMNRKRWKKNSMLDEGQSKEHRQRKKERDEQFFFFFLSFRERKAPALRG